MGKKITVKGHGVINACRKSETLWDDVYCSWTGKPGRTKYYFAPCLCSRTDVEYSLKYYRKHPDLYESDIKMLERIIEDLDNGNLHVMEIPDCQDIPDVYTPAEYIDRKEAERMLSIILKERYGFENVKFKWKRPKIVIHSV